MPVQPIAYLNEHHIQTAEDLDQTLQETEDRVNVTRAKMATKEKRMRTISDTTYVVRVHFSETSKETLGDKVKRLIREEVT